MKSWLFLLSWSALATWPAGAIEANLKTNFMAAVPTNSYVSVAVRSVGGATYTTGFSYDPILGYDAPFDIITTKYNRQGHALWTNVLPDFPAPVSQDIILDRQGHVLVLTSTWDQPPATSATSLRKIAPNGRVLWTRMLPAGDADYIHRMNDGSMLIPTGSNSVIQLDRHGDGLWTNQFGSPFVTGVGSDRHGNAYVAATATGEIAIGKFDRHGSLLWSNALPSFAERGSMAVDRRENLYVALAGGLLVKFTPDGVALWTNALASPDGVVDSPTDVAVDPHGDVYITGWNFNTPAKILVSAKVNPAGELIWLQAQSFTVGGGDYTSPPRFTRVHRHRATVVQHDKLYDNQGSYTFITQTFHYRDTTP